MTVAIVGLGLIGGSLAKDLRFHQFCTRIIGVDSNPLHATQALSLGIADEVLELEDAAAMADLVVLAVPVNLIPGLLSQTLDYLKPGGTVTDMGSTKLEIAQVAHGHERRESYVASHPMAGTEHSGPMAALLSLFKAKTAVICDKEQSGSEPLALIERLYKTIGARVIYMNSVDHDMHVAYVSHLSHISSFVLANTVLDKEKNQTTIFDLAGGGFESTVRLAKSSPAMWTPIFQQNRQYVVEALDSYIEQLQGFRESLISQNFQATHDLMENANQIRRVLANIIPSPSSKRTRKK
jgi:prephenate dehydrogenase